MLKRVFKAVAILSLMLMTACGTKEEVAETKGNEKIVVNHKLGTTEINGKPKRVVVFDYGVLDIVSHIEGVEVVGVAKGSSAFTDGLAKYNDEKKYPSVGTLFEPNFEKLFELKPDLIIISRRQEPVYKDLSEIAPTLFINSWGETYFEDLATSVETLGDVFGSKEILKEKLDGLTERVAVIKEKSKGKNALFVLANGGSLSVYGKGSRYDHLYSAFGFTPADDNIDESTHGNRVSYEYLYEKNPEYIFVLDRGAVTGTSEILAEDTMKNDIIESMDAYKNGNIIYLSAMSWYTIMGGLDSTEVVVSNIEGALK